MNTWLTLTERPAPVLLAPSKPCRKGHTGGRYASGQCKECNAIQVAKYRKNNPEKTVADLKARGAARAKRVKKLRAGYDGDAYGVANAAI